jgi:ribosomal protein S18 acetylase RimI-like enzyme
VDPRDHVDRIEGLQRLFMDRVALPYGEVWVAVDDDEQLLSVALWSLPTTAESTSDLHDMTRERALLEGSRHEASAAADAVVAPLRPTTPHYYLGAVGTRTDHQRRGLGTAVLAPMLARADAAGVDVYLETSALANVEFYRSLDFVIVDALTIADGGPNVWAMLRTRDGSRAGS